MVSLANVCCGESLTIKFIRNNVDLSSFGISKGKEITVIESGNSGVIIGINGKRIALDAVTASSVLV